MSNELATGLATAVRIGTVVHLQIQRARLIQPRGDGQIYKTGPLVATDELRLTRRGVLGRVGDGWMLDRHHLDHPENPEANRRRALSIGFTSHYAAMAERFGSVPIGVAGENLIVETDRMVTLDDIAGGIELRGASLTATIDAPEVAQPCVHFTRFLLGRPDAPLDEVKEPRKFLRSGMRGFVMAVDGIPTPVAVHRGTEVWGRVA